jgi:uncharacterized integral membrane protein (TIGR00698 family)
LTSSSTAVARSLADIRVSVPGLLLSSAVAIGAMAASRLIAGFAPIPAMVIALGIGIALNPLAQRRVFQSGLVFCLKNILRWAVALLGLRIALGEIVALGLTTAILVVVAMAATLVAGFLLARLFALERAYGALAGAGTAVCGASATLATSIVLPAYKGKEMDVAFVVVAVNALSTVAMVFYPLVCVWFGFDAQAAGVMLGATIHDVAQVVGAGYSVSETAGNTAVIVKLFRVFLMLPVVLAIGWLFARRAVASTAAKVPIPLFAVVFVALCALNSSADLFPALAPMLAWIKPPLIEASTWGLLIAISALGLGTSLTGIAALGWRHVATVSGTTLVILAVVTAGLAILR